MGGEFSQYDEYKSVIIVPVQESRYQTVISVLKKGEANSKNLIEFSSKVCPYHPQTALKVLLEENARFCHAKFVIADDIIKVEACTYEDSTSEDVLKEMIVEVAYLADEWEYRITGQDVH